MMFPHGSKIFLPFFSKIWWLHYLNSTHFLPLLFVFKLLTINCGDTDTCTQKIGWESPHVSSTHMIMQPLMLAVEVFQFNMSNGRNKEANLPHSFFFSPPLLGFLSFKALKKEKSFRLKQPTRTNLSASLLYRINKTVKEQITAGNSSITKHLRRRQQCQEGKGRNYWTAAGHCWCHTEKVYGNEETVREQNWITYWICPFWLK